MTLQLTLLCGYFTWSFFVILIKLTPIHSASHRNTPLFQFIHSKSSIFVFCISLIPRCCDKHHNRRQLREEWVYFILQLQVTVNHWRRLRHEPKKRPPEKHCSLSCPSWHPQPSGSQLSSSFLRVALSTVGWALPQWSLIATLPHREAHGTIWPRQLKFPLPSYSHLPGGKGQSAEIIRCLGVLSVTFAFNIAYLDVSLHHMVLNWASFYQPVCPHNTWNWNNQLSLSGFYTQPSVPRTFGGWRSLNLSGH